ncbi:NAD-dependent succinate-semialdehyde dehydrogenase [Acidipropionibacterium jensenii]|uniref:NAD-dependent succinate-semialdehyde dehydrogenase n=1 Tax=Acidipropionibacterium jensenii TaxID=1749 RepID=A0A3Q9UH10_9ACTN|nr:NAD-dependent succinate-semialdehyde dehydrogenase [Acidipropionibacterium jensenii]AZZ38559.1 NAD-dependent succinate-semialdehyde dehydrogenase [Acidipropionibacterium jensenii]
MPIQLPTTELLIDGRWRPAASGQTLAVENPATNEVICQISDGGRADAEAAIEAAGRAQAGWAATSPRERSEILRRAYELVMERKEYLATLMTAEMGKPLADARGEVNYGGEFLRWFSEEAVRIGGDMITTPDGATRIMVHRVPVGPVVIVTPWNFPLAMGTRKIGPAIAAGCTMVFKPAEQTPLTSLALADILQEAGLPDGVLNVVTTSSPSDVVTPWMASGVARKVSFTGSTAVGRILLAQSAEHVMRTSLELGGNAAFVVCRDADLDRAVQGAMDAKMRNMGEACTAANRLLVDRRVVGEFSERLAERMAALTVGNGMDEGVEVGPLIDAGGRQKVEHLVGDAASRGARILTGGERIEGAGYFYPPTVLTDVSPDADLYSSEIFGPVAPITAFDDEEEAIALANRTSAGLVGYVYSTDIDRAFTLAEEIEVGMVGINSGLVSNPAAPFGGVKESGLGREGSTTGIEEFLEVKYFAVPRRRPTD